MKARLIILSDLWGKEKSDWLEFYLKKLNSTFQIRFYNSCELAGIDKSDFREHKIHEQFVNGGIDKAVEQLIQKEKGKMNVLSFSVGGIIAWKAGLKGLDIGHLFAISSTRLRNETNKPKCNMHLYFGENDLYMPKDDWFEKMNLKVKIIEKGEHEMYADYNVVNIICCELIKEINE